MAQLVRKVLRAVLNYDPSFCDMHDDAHARAVAQEYLAPIRQQIWARFGAQRLTILDAGCQAGRLLIPLAEEGHHLIGVDLSPLGLKRAQRHAKERGLAVELHRGDLSLLRRWIDPASLDVVVSTEVLYLCRDYEALLRLLAESLKPDGLLCVSHRPADFYVGKAVRHGRLELARELLHRGDGASGDGDYHNWQTPQQLTEMYGRLGARILEVCPVDHERLPCAPPSDPTLSARLAPYLDGDGYCVPSYLLVIAEKSR